MVTSEAIRIILGTFFIILAVSAFVLSVFGNFVVIYVMTRERRLRKKSNYYIISVALADLLIGLLGIPFSAYAVKWQLWERQKNFGSLFANQWILILGNHWWTKTFLLLFVSLFVAAGDIDRFNIFSVSRVNWSLLCHLSSNFLSQKCDNKVDETYHAVLLAVGYFGVPADLRMEQRTVRWQMRHQNSFRLQLHHFLVRFCFIHSDNHPRLRLCFNL